MKQFNSKIRQEYIDYDYLDKLSDKEKAFLNAFTEEEIGANFNHKGKKLTKSKKKKREVYGKNNARNRCAYSKSRALNQLTAYTQKVQDMLEINIADDNRDYEDVLIEYLDNKLKNTENLE